MNALMSNDYSSVSTVLSHFLSVRPKLSKCQIIKLYRYTIMFVHNDRKYRVILMSNTIRLHRPFQKSLLETNSNYNF